MKPSTQNLTSMTVALAAGAILVPSVAIASSHREAPLITETPKVDGTDFYMFTSYEPGRSEFVTIVANYLPLQDAYGGPNYFLLDDDALYEIHISNDGGASPDITIQLDFENVISPAVLTVGPEGNQREVAIPLSNAGQITAGNNGALGVTETYTAKFIRAASSASPQVGDISDASDGGTVFTKPFDNIGTKSFPDYDAYAAQYMYEITIPGCATPGRLFVGQREDPFVVNLGETFDLVNLNPLGPEDGAKDIIRDKNVTSIILELPKECLLDAEGGETVIGAWTTARLPDGNGGFAQVSRLGHPLVNEVVIGLGQTIPGTIDKDLFNSVDPTQDGVLIDYVTHPTLPELLELLFGDAGAVAPEPPRDDLVSVFLTGLPGINQPAGVVGSEMLRLDTARAPLPKGSQSRLGALGGDLAGFPNGRRPGDDVVDIALRVVMGALLPIEEAPNKNLPFTDGAFLDDSSFSESWPYLNSPIPGSPNSSTIEVTVTGSEDLEGFETLKVTYDAVAQKISAPRVGLMKGFYRLEIAEPGAADSDLGLSFDSIQGDSVLLNVIKN